MRDTLHIGEVAALFGITPKTIRHYHKVGILPSPQRTASGYRLYRADALLRLLRIRRLQALGLSLTQIKTVLGASDQARTLREALDALQAVYLQQLHTVQSRLLLIQAILANPDDETLDVPSPASTILTEAQAMHVKDAEPINAQVWEQDTQIFGLLESLQWPDAPLESMRDAFIQFLTASPETYQDLRLLSERLAALAEAPPDAPAVAQFAAELQQHPLMAALQAQMSADVSALDTPFGSVMTDLMLSTLAPAQRRLIELVQASAPGKEKPQ